jgi:hypothetical protein
MNAIDGFLDELRSDRDLAAHADQVATALSALDFEGDGNPDAVTCFEAVLWILRQPRSHEEKIKKLHKLFALPQGSVHIPSMKAFCEW